MSKSKKNEMMSLESEDTDELTKKQFILQSEKLKLLLQVPKEQRNHEIVQDISEIAGQIKFLSSYRTKPEFLDLCKHLYIKTYDKRQQVFKQGEQGDAFYVILNGSVKVFIDEPTAYKNFMQLKEIAELKKGDAFGEISLLYNSKRTATVIANERSDMIVLEKDVFQELMKTLNNDEQHEMKTVHLNKLLLFLESLPVFALFNKDLLVQISTKCMIKQYPSQTILLKQGIEPNQMFIIRSGRVKVIKKIKLQSIAELQFPEDYFEIDELGDGDIFGDYALLNEEEAECSFVTAIPSEIISISSFNLKKIVPLDTLEVYFKSLKKYPEDDDLKQLFLEKSQWDKYKKKLFQNVMIEKQNKKGFDSRLRLPELKCKKIVTPINVIDIKSSDNRIYFKYLENKISPSAESKKKVQSVYNLKGKMHELLDQLDDKNSDQKIANSFQRKLKKLNIQNK